MRDADRCSGLSTINHWVTAVLVLAMLLLGSPRRTTTSRIS